MVKNFLCVCLVVSSTCSTDNLFAQDAKAKEISLHQSLSTLRAGNRVRISLLEKNRVEGKFQRVQHDSMFVREGLHETAIHIAEIRRVEVRRSAAGDGAKKGAIIFGILGLGGGIFLNEVCQALDDTNDPSGCPEAIVGLGAMGAAGGALLGAGIGAVNVNWREIYPRRR